MSNQEPVLIAGAGPTGLTLACTLLQHGVECRVIDRRGGPASEPKALILWSGALEVLRRIDVADCLTKRALPLAGASYWSNGKRAGQVRFGSLAGTAFPRPLCVPQSITEASLYSRLRKLGGDVEWNTTLVGVELTGGATASVSATLSAPGSTPFSSMSPRWLVGADGSHSKVREAAGIAFEGSTYARDFLLGDGEISGDLPKDEAQYHLTPEGVLVVVPLPGGGHRIFFDRDATGEVSPLSDDDLQALLTARGPDGWKIRRTSWRSTFRVHTKVASAFRSGPLFLAGDAAHCHSPAGGQGLNTGVQDAFNLGWKLAAVQHGADPALLDSYEVERRPAALRALRNSDRQTQLWMLRAGPKRVLRDTALRLASASGALDRKMVPELAQLDPGLESSPAVPGRLSAGGAAGEAGARVDKKSTLRPGGRLPDAGWHPLSGTSTWSLHELLAAGRHTLLVVAAGAGSADAERTAQETADMVGRSPVADQADVVLVTGLRPAGVWDDSVPVARVVETGQSLVSLAAQGPVVIYVRPDGAVGAWSSHHDLTALASGVSVLTAPAGRAA
ncbi:FAD-dependent monooxygenase [Streptomyces sp. V4I2]|uniref:FAD-dependent monooxygenase n=1 Tax=Streptomyces sp. V4I2 TaxID=3042280 RepID=UPI00278A0ED7|nr:FAD-dependent monooxygenase [Streptomyces sp. V4I2]MDQ1050292.1 2-polyprenyl-6-methoxyphenol hydroxylase-like FAD-dependent oxidoreductase [Streptomyces sp. V4I2]